MNCDLGYIRPKLFITFYSITILDMSMLDSIIKNFDANLLRDCGIIAERLGVSFLPDPDYVLRPSTLRCTITPRVFSEKMFSKVVQVVPIFQKLIHAIAEDLEWLLEVLEPATRKDEFTRRLCDIARDLYARKLDTSKSLSIQGRSSIPHLPIYALRSDYMTTDLDTRILQVEVNTMSSGFANAAEALSIFHEYFRVRTGFESPGTSPINRPGQGLARGLAYAHMEFFRLYSLNSKILFIVEPKERNEVDQRLLEIELLRSHGIGIVRKTLVEVHKDCELSIDGHLVGKGQTFSVAYFRAGYSPNHYPDESAWEARALIERSSAFKCPTILGQLAGTKKVQQTWYSDGGSVLGRFGIDGGERAQLLDLFAVQADPSVNTEIVSRALADPSGWILKPQREGGGNNLFKEDLKRALLDKSVEDLQQYVLMERMRPNSQAAIVSKSNPNGSGIMVEKLTETVCEVGIFSFYIPGSIDEYTGHLVRTKDFSVDEGGVNAGFAYLDTVCLV